MIHPSYKELMEKINIENEADNVAPVTSRYSVVLATSKRARQLTDGAEPLAYAKSGKALSIAVEEFYEGKVKFTGSEEKAEEAETEEKAEEAEVTEPAAEAEEEA